MQRSVAVNVPDLILLDVKLPNIDGYEVCRGLKSEEYSRKTPVIFITAYGELSEKAKGFKAGGIDCITKPYEPKEVLAKVRTHLRLCELAESEERLRTLLNNAADAIFLHDLQGQITYVNQNACDSLGYSRGELLQMNVADIDTEFISHDHVKEYWKEAEFGQPVTLEGIHKRKDCSVFPVEVRLRLLHTAGKESIIATARNVTDRKEVEKKLLEERKQLISMFDSMDEVVYVADRENYDMLYMNAVARKNWGDGTGRKCYKVLQNRKTPCPFCSNDKIFDKNVGKTYTWEFQNQINHRWYRCIDRAINWPDGRLVRFEMAVDINESKLKDEELAKYREQLEELVERRTIELADAKEQAEAANLA